MCQKNKFEKVMKKVNLFLVSLVTLVTLSVGLSSCDNEKSPYIGTWKYSEAGNTSFNSFSIRQIDVLDNDNWSVIITNGDIYRGKFWEVKRIDPGVSNVDYTGEKVYAALLYSGDSLEHGSVSFRIVLDSSNSNKASLVHGNGYSRMGTLTKQ